MPADPEDADAVAWCRETEISLCEKYLDVYKRQLFNSGKLLPTVRHSRVKMQRSIKPCLFRQTPSGRLKLDKPVTLIRYSDIDVCFPVDFGVVAINEVVQQPLLCLLYTSVLSRGCVPVR